MHKEETEENKSGVIRNQFAGYLLGVFLRYSSYCAILNLQSSINIEDGLGTISISVTYITCNIFLILFTTILLRKFGAKKCLIASEVTYMIYIVANLYPEFYTLIPAAVLIGIGEATIWSCMTIINYYFATQYARTRKESYKENEFYVNLYSGYFFTCIQSCQVFGNIVAYIVLYAFTGSDVGDSHIVGNTSTTLIMVTSYTKVDQFQYCGSQDCQNVETVDDSLNQYVPTNDITLLTLIGILTGICFSSIICHYYFVPSDISVSDVIEAYDADPGNGNINPTFEVLENTVKTDVNGNPEKWDGYGILKHVNGETSWIKNQTYTERDEVKDEITHRERVSTCRSSLDSSSTAKCKNKDGAYLTSLKDLGKQMLKPTQILLIPITLYYGLMEAFVFSELTRSLSSCVVGVEMVGVHMATYGLSNAVFSYIAGKLGQKLGRTPFFILATVFDISSYVYCLFWDPNLETSWSIFLVFLAFGVSDGIWQTMLNVLYLEYFEESRDVAISSWVLWSTLGYAIQFGWSTSLCVYIKIYIQAGMLVFGVITYGFAEYLHRKRKPNGTEVKRARL